MSHGFFQREHNGLPSFEHGGDTMYFHSMLSLVPSLDMGVFISTNSAGGSVLRDNIVEALVEFYKAEESKAAIKGMSDSDVRVSELVGSYRFMRMNYSDVDKSLSLFEAIKVLPAAEGRLMTVGLDGVRQWIEIDPYLFQEVGGESKISFRKRDSKHGYYLYWSRVPYIQLYRVPIYETPTFIFVMVAMSLSLYLPIMISLITKRKAHQLIEKKQLKLYQLNGITGLLNILFFVGFTLFLSGGFEGFAYEIPFILKATLLFPLLAMLSTCWSLWVLISSIREGLFIGKRKAQVYQIFLVIASLNLLWFYINWNLFGFQFG